MAEFGEQLKKAREANGLTQQSFAEKIYVTRQTGFYFSEKKAVSNKEVSMKL